MKTNKKKTDNYILIICIIFLAFLGGRTIPNATGVSALNDVFAYWGLGATLAGKNWTPLLKTVEYYACGYSFLLAPLFFLGLNATQMFQLALVINMILLIGIFLLTLYCINSLYAAFTSKIRIFMAFTLTVYSNNLIQAQETWTELFLVFLFWLLFALVVKLSKKPSTLVCIGIGIVSGYMYMVHMRALSAIIAVFLIMVFSKKTKYITWKHFMAFLCAILALVIVQILFMSWTKNLISSEDIAASANTYSGQLDKLVAIITSPLKMASFILACIGKLFYLFSASLLLVPFGIYEICATIKKQNKKEIKHYIPFVFLISSFLLSFCIGCIAISGIEGRLDLVVYGRYIESFIGPIMMVGLYSLMTKQINLKCLFMGIMLLFVLAIPTNVALVYVRNHGGAGFNWPCVTVWQRIYEVLGELPYFTIVLSLICSTFFVAAWTIIQYRPIFILRRFRQQIYGSVIALLIFTFSWIWCSLGNTQFEQWQKSIGDSMNSTMDLINHINGYSGNIYLVLSDEDKEQQNEIRLKYTGAKFLQSRLPNATINIISCEEYKKLDTTVDTIYLTISDKASRLVTQNNLLLLDTQRYKLYANANSCWAKYSTIAEDTSIEMASMFFGNSTGFDHHNSIITHNIEQEQMPAEYSVYGPYISVSPGTYEVKFSLELLEGDLQKINTEELIYGWCDVSTAQGEIILASQTLNQNTFSQGKSLVNLRFATDLNGLNGVEFRVFTGERVKLRVTDISYKKISNNVQVLLKNSADIDDMVSLLSLDTNDLPITVLANTGIEGQLSVSHMEEVINTKEHFISIRNIETALELEDTIIMLQTDAYEVLERLLPKYTVVLRLEDYIILCPTNSELLYALKQSGSCILSYQEWINIKSFIGSKKHFPNDIHVLLPEGKYEFIYDFEVEGAIYENNGVINIGIDNEWKTQILTSELVLNNHFIYKDYYEFENDTDYRFSLGTRGEVNIKEINIFLKRR